MPYGLLLVSAVREIGKPCVQAGALSSALRPQCIVEVVEAWHRQHWTASEFLDLSPECHEHACARRVIDIRNVVGIAATNEFGSG